MKPANDNGNMLSARMKHYEIPDLPYLPSGSNVLVYRLPSETKSAGGIIIAETARVARPMGVLVGAGLAARDVMADHLMELGDIVWFGRFHEYEEEVKRDPEGKGKTILQMKIADVLGSVDALERVRGYVVVREVVSGDEEQFVYKRAQ